MEGEQGDGCPTVDAEMGQHIILDGLEQRQLRGEERRGNFAG